MCIVLTCLSDILVVKVMYTKCRFIARERLLIEISQSACSRTDFHFIEILHKHILSESLLVCGTLYTVVYDTDTLGLELETPLKTNKMYISQSQHMYLSYIYKKT
jgi:hypothetical protein